MARRAGVNERTVYRHFTGERQLRDAVLAQLRDEAGVDLAGVRLDNLQEVATRIFEYVSSFPIEARTPADPTVAAENDRQRAALLEAVSSMPGSEAERKMAAGVLDVLWSPVSYERLVADWKLTPKEAIRALTWVIGLVQQSVDEGPRP